MSPGPRDAAAPRIGPAERAVSIPSVLEAAGVLAGLRRRGDRLVGPCPIHGGDNPTAFSVDLRLNRWYCFTGCSAGGDVVELVRRLHRVGFREATAILGGISSPGATSLPASHLARPAEPFRPFTRSIPLDPDCAFLQAKGISPATAARHEVGAYAGDGWLKGCVGVRLHDPAGRPLGYLARALVPTTHTGRWKLPPRLPKAQILYNYHRISRVDPPVVAVTECPWGVLRLAQLGIPAVALLGVHLSGTQTDLLASHPRVVLLLDADDAGQQAAQRIQTTLAMRTHTDVVHLPAGQDPDDLDDASLLALMSPLFPS
jgi:DNA primase